MEPTEHVAEVLRADRQHRRQPDRRIHRVTPADPVPEGEHVGGIDAELRDALAVRRHSNEVLPYRPLVAELAQAPDASRVGVGQRLDRRESLGTDDEQGLLGVEVTRSFHEVRAVDVGDEAERHMAPTVMPQRLVGHHRAEIGAADADVDDVADGPPGVPAPAAAAHLVAEGRHAVEHGVHLGNGVHSVDQHPLVLRSP